MLVGGFFGLIYWTIRNLISYAEKNRKGMLAKQSNWKPLEMDEENAYIAMVENDLRSLKGGLKEYQKKVEEAEKAAYILKVQMGCESI